MILCMSDMKEQQRETVMQTLYSKNIELSNLQVDKLQEIFLNLLCLPRSSIDNPSMVSQQGQRSFVVHNSGMLEGDTAVKGTSVTG